MRTWEILKIVYSNHAVYIKILENAKLSIVQESVSVLAWGWCMRRIRMGDKTFEGVGMDMLIFVHCTEGFFFFFF